MTLKSIITVEVDDSAFEAFKAKFEAFQKAATLSFGAKNVDSAAVWRSAYPEGAPEREAEESSEDAAQRNVTNVLVEIRDLVKKIAGDMKDSGGGGGKGKQGKDGFNIGGILSVLRGGPGKLLLGAIAEAWGVKKIMQGSWQAEQFVLNGSGLGKLAAGTTALRSAAHAANTSIGAYRAFQTDLGPYGDAEGLLNSVANAQSDITNPLNIALQRAGVNKWATADQGAEALLRRTMYDYDRSRSNPMLLQSYLQQDQLDSAGITTAFARSVGDLSSKEREQIFTNLHADKRNFNVQDHTAAQWQQLNNTIARSNILVQTAFTQTLPAAAAAAASASNMLAQTFYGAAAILQRQFPGITVDVNSLNSASGVNAFRPGTSSVAASSASVVPMMSFSNPKDANYYKRLGAFDFDNLHGAIAQTESSGNASAMGRSTRHGRAVGLYQIMPGTAAGYGYNAQQLKDPKVNAFIARQEWDKLLLKYNDPYMAAAAYNWGQGNLDKDIKAHGAAWRQSLPPETQQYITTSALAKAIQQVIQTVQTRYPTTKVAIHNSTGQDVSVQARMANR